jgi:hypothetical protein
MRQEGALNTQFFIQALYFLGRMLYGVLCVTHGEISLTQKEFRVGEHA